MILVIGDTQIKPGVNIDHIAAVGNLIVKERPETIVIIGDWWDFPSLSFFAKGKAEIEGKRLHDDIESGFHALAIMFKPWLDLVEKQRNQKMKMYNPRVVFTEGNHEHRLYRFMEDNPNMQGMFDIRKPLKDMGIEYHNFREVVEIDNILFSHFFSNPMSGRPWGGSIINKLVKIGHSFVQGHTQVFEYTERHISNGEFQFGVTMGAFYSHEEDYKGPQGNRHFRGVLKIHNAESRKDIEVLSIERLLGDYFDEKQSA